MLLIVKELDSFPTQQKILIGDYDLDVKSIRPHIYRHNFPTGSVKIQVLDENQFLVCESETLAVTQLDVDDATTGLAFFHGYIRFYINALLKAGTQYWIKLVGVGYTFSEAAYVGWCNDFDLQKVARTYVPGTSFQCPLDVELWTKNRIMRGFSL